MARFKYAVNTNSLQGLSPPEVAALCARLGYDGIEWGLPAADSLSKPIVQEMAKATSNEGLEVVGYINAGHLWKFDLMKRYSEIVASAEGRLLRVAHPWLAYNFDESLHQRDSFMDLFKQTREGLEALQPLGKEFGVRYVLEMHGASLTASAPACRYLMDGLDAESVGVIFDPANGIKEGFLRPRHATEVLGPYLAYVHAKNLIVFYAGKMLENPRRADWESRVVPLECGMIDWVEVYFALNCVGYEGWISVEEFFREDRESQLTRGLAFLKACEAAAPAGPEEPFTTFND